MLPQHHITFYPSGVLQEPFPHRKRFWCRERSQETAYSVIQLSGLLSEPEVERSRAMGGKQSITMSIKEQRETRGLLARGLRVRTDNAGFCSFLSSVVRSETFKKKKKERNPVRLVWLMLAEKNSEQESS